MLAPITKWKKVSTTKVRTVVTWGKRVHGRSSGVAVKVYFLTEVVVTRMSAL